MARLIRAISWMKGALKDFQEFPPDAQLRCRLALSIVAEGGMPDIAKPLRSLPSGVFELALPYRGDAFRVVYAVKVGEEIWVLHAFQKKAHRGIKTPQHEIDLIKQRLKRLSEILQL